MATMERKDLFDVVSVRGADALPFLQSQFAADLMALTDNEQRWSALLNPQGRVLFVVAAIRLAADDWRLLVPFARGAELVELLRRFVFRRKLVFTLDAEAHVGFATNDADPDLAVILTDDAVATISRDDVNRFIAAGLALIDIPAAGRHLVHALRFDRFDAFSVKKGCYPGQEIVARTHFLGRNKRVLVRIDSVGESVIHSGDRLRIDDQDAGEVVCAGTHHALAVVTQTLPVGQRIVGDTEHSSFRVAHNYTPES